MKTKLTKKQVEDRINEFFSDIKNKNNFQADFFNKKRKLVKSTCSPEEIRKIKRLAMHYKIKLGKKRKLFCRFCYSTKLKVKKIRKNKKTVECENCGRLMRWRVI